MFMITYMICQTNKGQTDRKFKERVKCTYHYFNYNKLHYLIAFIETVKETFPFIKW